MTSLSPLTSLLTSKVVAHGERLLVFVIMSSKFFSQRQCDFSNLFIIDLNGKKFLVRKGSIRRRRARFLPAHDARRTHTRAFISSSQTGDEH